MIQASDFLGAARRQSLSFFTGVPCSFLTPLINGIDKVSKFIADHPELKEKPAAGEDSTPPAAGTA